MTKKGLFFLFFGLGFLGLYFMLSFNNSDASKVQSILISLNGEPIRDTAQFGKLIQVKNFKDSVVATLLNKGSKQTFKRHISQKQLNELVQMCSSNQRAKGEVETQITIKYFDGSVQEYEIKSEQILEKYFVNLFKQ